MLFETAEQVLQWLNEHADAIESLIDEFFDDEASDVDDPSTDEEEGEALDPPEWYDDLLDSQTQPL